MQEKYYKKERLNICGHDLEAIITTDCPKDTIYWLSGESKISFEGFPLSKEDKMEGSGLDILWYDAEEKDKGC